VYLNLREGVGERERETVTELWINKMKKLIIFTLQLAILERSDEAGRNGRGKT
jgi:hypothetical protein